MDVWHRGWARPQPSAEQLRHDVIGAVVLAAVSVVSAELFHSAFGTGMGRGGIEAYAWFAVAGLLLAGRRRFPLTTLVLESAVFMGVGIRFQELVGAFTMQMFLFAALYAAWAWSRRPRALVVVTAAVLLSMFGWLAWQFADPGSYPQQADVGLLDPRAALVVYSLAINVVYFLGAIAWGQAAWRSARRSALIVEQREREQAQQVRERDQAVQAERVRIARDLHDVVAHHVSGMGVQAAGAARTLDRDPEAARDAMGTIERSSRQAVKQMHQLVRLLRQSDDTAGERLSQPGLAEIAELASDDDVPVIEHRQSGQPFEVPGTVEASMFRIAQEAVTNVRRHAGARHATLAVRYLDPSQDRPRAVEVEVVDDGRGRRARSPETGGYGLVGIRERAAMHDGEIEVGPRPNGGFRVRVRIPVDA